MSDVHGDKPLEEIKNATQQAAEKEAGPPPKRDYRTWAFQVALYSAIGAFAVLTIMVKSTPFFPLDIQITQALQAVDSPLFVSAMNLISWPGFLPQSAIIPALAAVLLYSFGLRWEAVTSVVAALLPPVINLMVKEWIRRPRPTVDLVKVLRILDSYSFPSGHVMFYSADEQLLFCGDVIFQGSIGRTDLPGGDFGTLIASLKAQVLTLPDETRLLSGHGPETTVGRERRLNPFLQD